MRSTDPVRVRSVCQSGPRSALRRPWSPSASGVPTTTAERPSQPGRRQISARTQATKSIDSSYLRMLHHLADYAHPSSDFAGLSKDPFLRPSSTRTGRGAYVAYGSFATEMSCPRHVRFTPPDSDRMADIAARLEGTRIRLMQHSKQREPGIKRHLPPGSPTQLPHQ